MYFLSIIIGGITRGHLFKELQEGKPVGDKATIISLPPEGKPVWVKATAMSLIVLTTSYTMYN